MRHKSQHSKPEIRNQSELSAAEGVLLCFTIDEVKKRASFSVVDDKSSLIRLHGSFSAVTILALSLVSTAD